MSGATMPGRDREPGTGGRIETSAIGDSDRLPLIRPMLAVLRDALPDDDAAWGYEFKWDGVRAVAYLAGDHVRLLSRNDRDMTGSYPELVDPLRTHRSGGVVVDGELVAIAGGRPSFAALQHRMHVRRPDPGLVAATPVTYMVFDVLHLDGRSTLTLPYRERRGLLEGLRFAGGRVEIPPYYAGGGAQVLAASGDGGLEGVVAKRLDAAYHPGRRSPVWLKVKNFRTQEVVLGGWTPGKGHRANRIGSLLLGIPGPGGLAYCGQVGTGFTEEILDDLRERLGPLEVERSPFAGALPAEYARIARWARPELVGEVRFSEWTGDGRLRHPSWRGLRPDKSPADVTKES
jgi:bifunctional non-homologous end joining protein LigD